VQIFEKDFLGQEFCSAHHGIGLETSVLSPTHAEWTNVKGNPPGLTEPFPPMLDGTEMFPLSLAHRAGN
jgi:hypothetical protein